MGFREGLEKKEELDLNGIGGIRDLAQSTWIGAELSFSAFEFKFLSKITVDQSIYCQLFPG